MTRLRVELSAYTPPALSLYTTDEEGVREVEEDEEEEEVEGDDGVMKASSVLDNKEAFSALANPSTEEEDDTLSLYALPLLIVSRCISLVD